MDINNGHGHRQYVLLVAAIFPVFEKDEVFHRAGKETAPVSTGHSPRHTKQPLHIRRWRQDAHLRQLYENR